MTHPTDLAYRAAARAIYEEGSALGTLDIPIGAEVRSDWSEAGDAGAWVECWAWVPDSAALAHDPLAAMTVPDVPDFVRRAIDRRAALAGVA